MTLFFSAVVAVLLSGAPGPPVAAPRARSFRLTCQAMVPAPPVGTKALDVWLPVPHADKNQHVTELKIDAPASVRIRKPGESSASATGYTIETDRYGNQMLHLRVVAGREVAGNVEAAQLSQLPLASIAPFTLTLTARVTRREHLNLRATDDHAPAETEARDPNLSRWLAPDRLVPLDAQIKAQAQEVVTKAGATTDLAKARAIYEHVVGTMTYDKTGQGWGRGDIYYACDARRGNCTDFHAVFIGYCRALGIPARFSIGLPLPAARRPGEKVEVKGYHCWAEFYTKQTGWVPIDASEAAKNPAQRGYFFGAHDENRVEFTRGRDLALAPVQAGAPLNYFVFPYAEADGQPLEVGHAYFMEDEMTAEKPAAPGAPAKPAAPTAVPAAPALEPAATPASAPKPTGALSPAAPAAPRLVFVYNADTGVLNGLKDMVHKAFAPSTYPCDLCAITYDFTGMRADWKQAVRALPLPSEFLHRDEFLKAYPAQRSAALPAAFYRDATGQLAPFLSAAEIKPLTLDGLIAEVKTRAAARVSAQP